MPDFGQPHALITTMLTTFANRLNKATDLSGSIFFALELYHFSIILTALLSKYLAPIGP
jgi:hypothetical protein